jgi:hydrogenase nickel incorporation protein HypB
MCATCGCSDGAGVRVTDLRHGHGHGHDHAGRTVSLELDVLAGNDRLAAENRAALARRGILALNLMSSPGSGKTTLLVRTLTDLGAGPPISVVEGDQETLLDAERIGATGARVVQVNTGAGCHLDAAMLADAVAVLDPPDGSLLLVENVGNLVCPALFDLGEAARVVVMSVTEGADKPLKYPHMFRTADLVLINKIDLLPYVEFDVGSCVDGARRARPGVEVIEVSATRGDGLDGWYAWLDQRRAALTRA